MYDVSNLTTMLLVKISRSQTQFEADVEVEDKRALRILKRIPFVVPTALRVSIFAKLIAVDKELYAPCSNNTTLNYLTLGV